VTIACVGEAAAKMKLMDFHPHGNRQASVAERQATLRMITADYCGTGHSFTVNGTQVAWRDAAGQIEPRWERTSSRRCGTKTGRSASTSRGTPASTDVEECVGRSRRVRVEILSRVWCGGRCCRNNVRRM
jgi:hypothetical protein